MAKKTTEPADSGPVTQTSEPHSDPFGPMGDYNGITVRDLFAAAALAGLIAKEGMSGDAMTRLASGNDPAMQAGMFAGSDARRCYIYADAMIAARRGGAR